MIKKVICSQHRTRWLKSRIIIIKGMMNGNVHLRCTLKYLIHHNYKVCLLQLAHEHLTNTEDGIIEEEGDGKFWGKSW